MLMLNTNNLLPRHAFILLLIIIAGCGISSVHQKKTPEDSISAAGPPRPLQQTSVSSDTAAVIKQAVDGAYYLHFTNNKCVQRFQKEKDRKDTLTFYGNNGQTIAATIENNKEEGTAIRFSQIIMPNGSMDGPFSTEINYKLQQQGYYKLIIADNLMAADHAFAGKYTIMAELK